MAFPGFDDDTHDLPSWKPKKINKFAVFVL